ncbi:ubiquinol cytochrome c reductase subunit qcr9 [Plasmopara halstedii]|uniref:Ubiquinol cytochrome c reductase subunit qcr9 n=1 Tax=Plasmopara halstedii TaxID=4781 RepID=A0A0P1AAF3_PLAHL|nr:ubiquinol cytochrome c reductase subunit qcr9 [Plasmopara halstedii]CEG37736.1 ubiquinol cytochrome c reductase subunit qcr9 [Plasmopara halstedii]|eukprot:XP_024574105.1 ubiquinol cytochrome c reductase subunit qcr9 [Plasmopara halstedii]
MASTKRSSVNGKGALDGAYKVFMKSTPVYVTTVLIATLVAEGIYGSATNYIWETNNRGRLYHHIDWSKFSSAEEEDEDEGEDEEDEAKDEEEEDGEDLHDDDEDDV